MSEPLLLTVSGAARVLGVSRYTVSDMCRRFELRWLPWRGSKVHKRIPRAEIDRYIRAHTVGNAHQVQLAIDGRRRS